MKEGNLSMPTWNPHRTIVTMHANRNISLSNKKKWMLEYSKILYNIISPALKDWNIKLIKSTCLKNYVNMVSNLILLSKKLESVLVSRLNT